MGQLHSKNVCKRRESPEGGTLASATYVLQKESVHPRESEGIKNKQNKCSAELRDDQFLDYDCPLEVILPPEKIAEYQSLKISQENRNTLRRNETINNMDYNVPYRDENNQEWVFTLYDFENGGSLSKKGMSSLMHKIYEVVEASMKQSVLCDNQTLKVRLTLTPLSCSNIKQDWDSGMLLDKSDLLEKQWPTHHRGQDGDQSDSSENTEHRNHYLDLAGIENYNSEFEADNTLQSAVDEQCQANHAHGAHLTQYQGPRTNHCGLVKSTTQSIPILKCLRSRSKSMGSGGSATKNNKINEHHPVSGCCSCSQQKSIHDTGSKRAHAVHRDAMTTSIAQSRLEMSSRVLTPVAQRHEHHHIHEHHHHYHHHHHYYSS